MEALQFHPTADGVLVSAAGRTVKVWDVAKQQPLTGTATLEGLPSSLATHVWTTLPFSIGVFGSVIKKKNVSRTGYNSVVNLALHFRDLGFHPQQPTEENEPKDDRPGTEYAF